MENGEIANKNENYTFALLNTFTNLLTGSCTCSTNFSVQNETYSFTYT